MVITCTSVIERVHERQDNNTSSVNLLFYRLPRFRAGGLPRSLFTLGIRNTIVKLELESINHGTGVNYADNRLILGQFIDGCNERFFPVAKRRVNASTT